MNDPSEKDRDERVSLSGLDPEDALRGLMKVDPGDLDLPPEAERCPSCGGEGWKWEPAVFTVPPQAPDWQLCRACNGTGLEAWTKNTPRRPKPTAPPAQR